MLKIYVLGHSDECFDCYSPKDFLISQNLNQLELRFPNRNCDGECRFFIQPQIFCDSLPEYVGSLTWKHNLKYKDVINLETMDALIGGLHGKTVYASAPTSVYFPDWISYTHAYHRTISAHLEELARMMGMPLNNNPTCWANNFVCHRDVMLDLMRVFREVYPMVNSLYDGKIDIKCDDPNRSIAYLYERVSMIYFANRPDLEIKPMPHLFSQFAFFASYTLNYKPLHDLWRETLIGIGVKAHNIYVKAYPLPDNPPSGEVRFKTKAYALCLLHKVKNNLEQLLAYRESGASHKYLVLSDSDIWFIQNREHSWKQLVTFIEQSDADLFYPFERIDEEGKQVLNAGFLIFKSCKIDRAIQYFTAMLDEINYSFENLSLFDLYQKYPFIDQSIVNQQTFGLKVETIPTRWHVQGNYFKEEEAKTVLFHHAIQCRTMREKMDQINRVAGLLAGY